MNDIMFIVIIILLMVLTWVLLPQFLYKRAIKKVIKIFNEYNAFSVESAKTPRDLGLAQRGWIQNLGRNRDYKPRALQMLIDYKIILKTADDRVYLDKTQAALYKL
jgi:hypothetical protein